MGQAAIKLIRNSASPRDDLLTKNPQSEDAIRQQRLATAFTDFEGGVCDIDNMAEIACSLVEGALAVPPVVAAELARFSVDHLRAMIVKFKEEYYIEYED